MAWFGSFIDSSCLEKCSGISVRHVPCDVARIRRDQYLTAIVGQNKTTNIAYMLMLVVVINML